MKALRFLAGFGLMMAAAPAMRFVLHQTDDPSARLILIPIFLALSGGGLVLMRSANDDHGSLGSGGITLGLSHSTTDVSVEPLPPPRS
jgi:hypothetical protein